MLAGFSPHHHTEETEGPTMKAICQSCRRAKAVQSVDGNTDLCAACAQEWAEDRANADEVAREEAAWLRPANCPYPAVCYTGYPTGCYFCLSRHEAHPYYYQTNERGS